MLEFELLVHNLIALFKDAIVEFREVVYGVGIHPIGLLIILLKFIVFKSIEFLIILFFLSLVLVSHDELMAV